MDLSGICRSLAVLRLAPHRRAASTLASSTRSWILGAGTAAADLAPSHRRYASALHSLQPASGSTHARKRLGRGQASGRGGTSTKGHKGQNARSGNGVRLGFAGGQTPITRLFPKRGKLDPHRKEYVPLPLNRIQTWIDQGRLDPSRPITMKDLLDSRCVHKVKDGVELVTNEVCELRTPITVVVSSASPSAVSSIERLSGTVLCQFHTGETLRAELYPHRLAARSELLPPPALPTRRNDWLRYADWEGRRGYLGNSEVTTRVLAEVARWRRAQGWATRAELMGEAQAAVDALHRRSGKRHRQGEARSTETRR